MTNISEGVELFNNYNFFEAHDYFEDIWFEAASNEKLFFQGLVQISVGCYHLICGNLKGAKSQLTKGNCKLKGFEPSFYNMNITELRFEIDVLLEKLDSTDDVIKNIPTIEFIN